MRSNFEPALDHLDESEGGYVDHKKDPGGATNYGITNRTYQAWQRSINAIPRHVKYISKHEVEQIYKANYWDAVRADELPSGIDYAVFDAAVNSGPSRGVRWLQKAIGVKADGRIGPITLAKVNGLNEAAEIEAIDRMLDFRLGFMRRARHPVTKALLWPTFKGGWSKRVAKVRKIAKDWARRPNEHMIDTPNNKRPSFWALLMDAIEALFGRK